MTAPNTLDQPVTHAQPPHLDTRLTAVIAIACVCAGIAPLAARWIADDTARIACGVLIAAAFLAFTVFAKTHASLHQFWELAFAFFVLAVVQVLNNSIPGYVGTVILRDPPNGANPFASTISGTVVIQLVGTLIAVVPVVVLTYVSRGNLGSIYARTGVIGRWLALAIVFFVVIYVFTATIPLRPESPVQRLFPTPGVVTLDRFLALAPALLVVALSNGFEEEFLFRGLFLQKYNWFFDARVANVVQALVFSTAHAGVTYTPSALLFVLVLVFPLGLAFGYLMRATNGVLVPAVVHGALDMPIYVGFLFAAS